MDKREKEINLRDYFIVIDKRKWIIILSMILVLLLSLIFMPRLPPVYKATATLSVEEIEAGSEFLKGLAAYHPGTLMESQIKLIKSQFLAEEVARYLMAEMAVSLKVEGGSAEWVDSETVPMKIRRNISGSKLKDTNLLEINVTAGTPKAAMKIANSAARICVAEGLKGVMGGVETAAKFVEEQLQEFKKKLIDSEKTLADYKTGKGFGPLSLGLNKMDILEDQYVRTKLDRQIAEARLKVIKEHMARQQKEISPPVIQTKSALISRLRDTVVDLELKRALLLREYTEKHPEVVDLQAQIDETIEALKEETLQATKTGGMAFDPWSVYQERNKQILDLEVEIDSAKIREDALIKLLNEYSSKMAEEVGGDTELLRLSQNASTNKKTYSLLLDMKENLSLAASLKKGKVRIFRLAAEPSAPIERKGKLKFLISAFLGLVLGIMVAFVQEHMDTSLKTIYDIEQYLNKPVIGVIPFISPRGEKKAGKRFLRKVEEEPVSSKKIITQLDPKSPEAEAYRTLRTNIAHVGLPETAKVLLITSAYPEEGKTITLVNLGVTMAEMGKKVLIVDADMRRPAVYRIFGMEKSPGLAEILSGNLEWDKVLRPSGKENMSIITSGAIPPNPAELIASGNMNFFLNEVRACFDIILLDCPSILAVTDAAIFSPLSDGVILVVRAEKTPRESAQRAVVLLENVESRVLGIVFNSVSTRRSYYYYYYRYKYDGEAGKFSRKKLQKFFGLKT